MSGSHALSRRSLFKVAGGVGAASMLAACGNGTSNGSAPKSLLKPKADGNITWFTYEAYVDPKLVSAFERRYGVTVEQVYYTNAEGMVQKVASGMNYDLVTTNSAYNANLIKSGLLRGFDPADVKDFDQIGAYFQKAPYDSASTRYTIPYGYGPAGIAYQKGKVDVTGSWNDLWDNPGASGRIFVLEQQDETLGMSLIRNGDEVNTEDAKAITAAVDGLIDLKPRLGGLSSDINTLIAGGDALMTHAWAGSVYQALQQAKNPEDWDFVWPDEGLSMGCDTLSVAANAKSPGTALLFMEFLLAPENSYANTSYMGYSNGTEQGEAAYGDLTKKYPFLTFPSADFERAQWREAPTGARLQLWNQQWGRFRA